MARPRRRSGGRARSRRSGGSGAGKTLLYAIIALAMLATVGGAAYWLNREVSASAIDKVTLCPLSGPIGMTAILVDLTDPLSPAQGAQLRAWLDKEIEDAPRGTQFTMGIVGEGPATWGATEPLCKPQDAASANALTQNSQLIGNRYQERFRVPLDANIDRMTQASQANRSPIMESLQALIADTPGFVTYDGPKRIVLVSDLLQHSDVLSFYRGGDWESFLKSPDFQRMGATLRDAQVAIYQVPRPYEGIKDPASVEDFWMRYFDHQMAHRPETKRLGDL